MTRMLAIALAGFLVLSLWTPAGASSSTRKVTRQYTRPNAVVVAGLGVWFDLNDEPSFSARSGEGRVSFAIEDDFGTPVRGHIHLDRDGDGELDAARDFCGATSKPLSITPRSQLEVWVVTGACPDGSPAFATSGTVTAIFRT